MEPIKVTTNSKITHINSHRAKTTIDELRPLVTEFISLLEVSGEFNEELYNEIVNLDINVEVFAKMLNELDLFMEFDDIPDESNFPYQEWLPQLLLINENYKK